MSGNAVIDKKRVELVRDLPLSAGGHSAPSEGECPDGMCAVEKFAFITGQHWTDHPNNCCPTLAAFMRSFNDRTDQAGRDRLDAWIFENVEAIVATANDGRSEWRGFVSSDYAIRVALPVWLDLAGVKDAAAQLRALPEITDRALAAQGWEVVRQARKQLPDWYEARRELRRKVEAAVKKALADKKPADAYAYAAAVAAADAYAAAAAYADAAAAADAYAYAAAVAAADAYAAAAAYADAAADAVAAAAAAAYADAVAVAVADAVAGADADAVAYAYADAVAYADADADAAAAAVADAYADAYADADAVAYADADADADRWRQIRQKVYAAVKERMVPIYNQKFEEAGVLSFGDAAFELLDRMVAPVVAGQGDKGRSRGGV